MTGDASQQRSGRRRGVGLIILGAVLLLGGAAGGIALPIWAFFNAMQDVQRDVFPGTAEFVIERSGTHSIAYEYESVIDGRTFSTPERLPEASFQLWSAAGTVELETPPGSPTYESGSRRGRVIFTAEIESPGTYSLQAVYRDGSAEPQFVLAIMPGTMMGMFGRMFLGICGGSAIALLGLVLCVVGFVKLARSQ